MPNALLRRIGAGALAFAAAAVVGIAGGAISTTAAPQPAQAASTAGGPITRSEVLSRAQSWVDRGLTYSSGSMTNGPGGGSYNRDCSGLVSMAWHLTSNQWTGSFPDAGV